MDFKKYRITEADIVATKKAHLHEDGRLKSFPNKQKKQVILIEEISKRFADDRIYMEKELNAILKEIHADFAILRRSLIDYGFLDRKEDGSAYWKRKKEQGSF